MNFAEPMQNGWLRRHPRNIRAISPEEGAKTSIYLASSHEVKNITGKYFYKSKPVKSSKASYDREAQKKLWKLSEDTFKDKLNLLPRIAEIKTI